MDKFKDKNEFDIDWSEIYLLVERSFDFLENEEIKFDFQTPQIKQIIKGDIERNILRLAVNNPIEPLLNFVEFNNPDGAEELINDLTRFKQVLNSEYFRGPLELILSGSKRGRPEINVVLMFNILILQVLHGYSDNDIIKRVKTAPFSWFLDYPEEYPAESTFWTFKEKLTDPFIVQSIWQRHQIQLCGYGYGFEMDLAEEAGQDSTIITADQGNYSAPRGAEALTCRSSEGSRVKKGNQWYFGFKLHQAMDLVYQLIRFFEVTTASAHDNQTIFNITETALYRDKGYTGVVSSSYPAIMLKKSNDPLTNEHRKQRNKRISSKRAPTERPFARLTHFKAKHVKTTTIARTKVRMLAACIIFNIQQVITLQNQAKKKKKEDKKEPEIVTYDVLQDNFTLTPEGQKLNKFITNLKKRHKKSKKDRKPYKYMHKKTTRNKKIEKNEQPNLKTFTSKKLDYTFSITQ